MIVQNLICDRCGKRIDFNFEKPAYYEVGLNWEEFDKLKEKNKEEIKTSLSRMKFDFCPECFAKIKEKASDVWYYTERKIEAIKIPKDLK